MALARQEVAGEALDLPERELETSEDLLVEDFGPEDEDAEYFLSRKDDRMEERLHATESFGTETHFPSQQPSHLSTPSHPDHPHWNPSTVRQLPSSRTSGISGGYSQALILGARDRSDRGFQPSLQSLRRAIEHRRNPLQQAQWPKESQVFAVWDDTTPGPLPSQQPPQQQPSQQHLPPPPHSQQSADAQPPVLNQPDDLSSLIKELILDRRNETRYDRLAKFTGETADFPRFIQGFLEAVDSMPYTSAYKFSLLIGKLDESSASLVMGFLPCGYDDALAVLHTRYSSGHRVEDQVFAELKKIPNLRQSKDVNAIFEAYCIAKGILLKVQRHGLDLSFETRILEAIYSRFPLKLGFDYIEELATSPPRLEPYICSMDKTIMSLFRRDALERRSKENCFSPPETITSTSERSSVPSKAETERVVHFTSSTSVKTKRIPPGIIEGPCAVEGCGQAHGQIFCYHLPLGERRKLVKQYRLCHLCLEPGHHSRECNSPFRCPRCGGLHCFLMCVHPKTAAVINKPVMQVDTSETPAEEDGQSLGEDDLPVSDEEDYLNCYFVTIDRPSPENDSAIFERPEAEQQIDVPVFQREDRETTLSEVQHRPCLNRRVGLRVQVSNITTDAIVDPSMDVSWLPSKVACHCHRRPLPHFHHLKSRSGNPPRTSGFLLLTIGKIQRLTQFMLHDGPDLILGAPVISHFDLWLHHSAHLSQFDNDTFEHHLLPGPRPLPSQLEEPPPESVPPVPPETVPLAPLPSAN